MKIQAKYYQPVEVEIDVHNIFSRIKEQLVSDIKSGVESKDYDFVFLRDGKWYGQIDMDGRGTDIVRFIRDASHMEEYEMEALSKVESMVLHRQFW